MFYGTPCDYFDADHGFELSTTATFDGGDNITFEYRGIAGSVTTGPSGGFVVTGSIGGVELSIDEFYRIYYSPSHHHFSGNSKYAVLFDSEINGACGLRLSGPQDTATAALVDCDLNDVQALTISDSAFEVFADE